MFYKAISPPHPLSQFIVSIWYGENAPAHSFERLLPNGDTDLTINLDDGTLRFYDQSDLNQPRCFSGPVVSGAHSTHYGIDTSQQSALLGVKFRPGGAYPFFGDSADALHNLHVALQDLWGSSAGELHSRLMQTPTLDARFTLVQEALLCRLSHTHRTHPAVAGAVSTILAQQGAVRMGAYAARISLSQRRFIEIFRGQVGLSPKTFCRILRFQRALELVRSGSRLTLTTLALDCGYYDQSHFIREFKEMTGLSPRAYLAMQGVYDNHVPLAG